MDVVGEPATSQWNDVLWYSAVGAETAHRRKFVEFTVMFCLASRSEVLRRE